MIIPIRCFTCGKVIGNKRDQFLNLVRYHHYTEGQALDEIGLERYCCRRMMLTHVDLVPIMLKYNPKERQDAAEVVETGGANKALATAYGTGYPKSRLTAPHMKVRDDPPEFGAPSATHASAFRSMSGYPDVDAGADFGYDDRP
eukprot:TRINITY_DN14559_c0_g1_i1.p1 TRINITY_DN14559_c0_g1~~TRINITY_DN14559_c0_g1_i1.p1  ORF type:complete len:144 (+),score=13.98 TRINITY_DN14559_c0_g1_i1:69-500(+)